MVTNDLISRQVAIDVVGSMLRRKFGIGGDLAEITLADLPSAQPEPRWIPVTERLPEYGESVLCYYEDDDYGVNHIIDDEDGEWFIDGVVTWMPLPEPYKKETEEI